MSSKPVVVGVDRTPESLVAVELAVAEAEARHTGLRIVHAVSAADPDNDDYDIAAAAAHAAAKAPGVPTSTATIHGDPIDVFAAESRQAGVLVVGRRRSQLARLRSVSTVARLAAHTACPIIVAQGVSEAATNILVGVGDGDAASALAFAFAEAQVRRTGVTAIHAWRSPALVGPADDRGGAARTLSEALCGWGERYPDIDVRRSLPESGTIEALVEASIWAQMLVLGTATGRLAGFAPVIHEMVRRALCPVVIVPA